MFYSLETIGSTKTMAAIIIRSYLQFKTLTLRRFEVKIEIRERRFYFLSFLYHTNLCKFIENVNYLLTKLKIAVKSDEFSARLNFLFSKQKNQFC